MFLSKAKSEIGTTLVELMIGIGLLGMVAFVASSVQTRFSASTSIDVGRVEAATEVDALVKRLTHFWGVRDRPDPSSAVFAAPLINFRLLDANGVDCTTNCAKLVIWAYRCTASCPAPTEPPTLYAAGATPGTWKRDMITVSNLCASPGSGAPTLGDYTLVAGKGGLADTCLSCAPNTVPTVVVSSSLGIDADKSFPNTLYDTNGTLTAPGLRGLAACFQQSAGSAMTATLTSFVHENGKGKQLLLPQSRELTLPLAIVGNLKIIQ